MVLYITTNGKSDTEACYRPFTLMYRRVNGNSYEFIKFGAPMWRSFQSRNSILHSGAAAENGRFCGGINGRHKLPTLGGVA